MTRRLVSLARRRWPIRGPIEIDQDDTFFRCNRRPPEAARFFRRHGRVDLLSPRESTRAQRVLLFTLSDVRSGCLARVAGAGERACRPGEEAPETVPRGSDPDSYRRGRASRSFPGTRSGAYRRRTAGGRRERGAWAHQALRHPAASIGGRGLRGFAGADGLSEAAVAAVAAVAGLSSGSAGP